MMGSPVLVVPSLAKAPPEALASVYVLARELRSAREVQESLAKQQIELKRPGVVLNMPMITWPPGGRR